jgi:hypothetical protein
MSSKSAFLNSIYNENQNNQLFQLVLAVVNAKIEDDKQIVFEERELKKKLLREKFKVRIQTIITTATATATVAITSSKVSELNELNVNDEKSDEISLEVRFHHARFTDLSTNEIVKIFNEKFKFINLYKLRHERILDHEFFENQNRIELKNDQLKNLKKTIEFYKDYEKTFYEMYAKIFINYLHITTSLFIKINSDLCFTLIKFY